MANRSVVHDLRDYLTGATQVPDTVIATPFDASQIVVGSLQKFSQSRSGYQVILKEVSGTANPRWLRDEWTVAIQVIGDDRGKYMECEQKLIDITYTLIGSNTVYIGDRAYLQFTSNQLPQFVGHMDNSRPVFSSTIRFVVEGLKDEYNRKALC